MRKLMLVFSLCAGVIALASCGGHVKVNQPQASSAAIDVLIGEARAVRPLVSQAAAIEFLRASETLVPQASRTVYVHATDGRVLTPSGYEKLATSERTGFEPKSYDERFYYSTFYGSPVAYVRALEIAGQNGVATLDRAKVLDIGYGAIGGPRLMAGAGATISAVDVDPLLPALYREAGDQGSVQALSGRRGVIKLFDGIFSGNEKLTREVGGGYTLILSKNTMKMGFMKPSGERKPMVSFAASDAALLASIHDALAPGGIFVIYNIGGVLDPKRPSTVIASPFTREQFARAKLAVLKFDENDDVAVRAMGGALGWDKQMGDLQTQLFAQYTVVQRRP
jgi:SAM-dependent methyltransferase